LAKLLGPSLISQIEDAGYNFDFIDDDAIARVGVPHPVLILPNVERIPWSSYQKIEEYARRGGVVLALRRAPSLAPGLSEAERDTPRILELSRRLFSTEGARGLLVANESQLGEALRRAVAPDAALPHDVGFVHRKLDDGDIYFLANTSNRPVRGSAEFSVSGRSAQWWDPFNGKAARAGNGRIDLALAPYESRVLVFSSEVFSGARLQDQQRPPSRAAAIDVSSAWSVRFPGSPQPVMMPQLRSWTDDPDRKYFSGAATYERTVNIDRSLLGAGREVFLNFGEGAPLETAERRSGNGMRAMLEGPVREAAVVYVNGKLAGSVWRPPYEVSVGSLLRSGQNTLRVMVANLAINQLAKGPLPAYKELNARFGERFQPQDMANLKPLPSGLLGPVHLIPR
jgi:hypothetical protein